MTPSKGIKDGRRNYLVIFSGQGSTPEKQNLHQYCSEIYNLMGHFEEEKAHFIRKVSFDNNR